MAADQSDVLSNTLHSLFKRCVQCENQQPSCPVCPGTQICSLVPQSCGACAHMTCIDNPSPPPPSSSSNVGAIAGGIIGALLGVALVAFLTWHFWIKKQRAQNALESAAWAREDALQKGGSRFSEMRSDAASTRTRASFATSILSRASNIIQIAYIPGVTNRNGSNRNTMAPVPPIPAAYAQHTPKSQSSNQSSDLFFRPRDLRGSTYSGTSTLRSNIRDTQYSHHSLTPSLARSSFISTIYRDDATIEPMPATTIVRAAPRMVSVKGQNPAQSPGTSTNSNFSPGEQASPNATFARATPVTVSSARGRFPVQASNVELLPSTSFQPRTPTSPLSEDHMDSDDEDEHWRARQSLGKVDAASIANPPSNAAVARAQQYTGVSAKVDSSFGPRPGRSDPASSALSVVSEESAGSSHRTPGSGAAKSGAGPFSDIYMVD